MKKSDYAAILISILAFVFAIAAIIGFGITAVYLDKISRQISDMELVPNITMNPPTMIIEPLNRYWNETELERVKRECGLLCVGFGSFIPVIHTNSCVCCNDLDEIYSECVYWGLE